MFVRKRQSLRHPSHQVIETYHEGGKVRQRVLANLGRCGTIEDAIRDHHERIARCERIPRGEGFSRPRSQGREKIKNEITWHRGRITQLEALWCQMCHAGGTHFDTTRGA
jgi:hypothetical protein